MTLRKYTALLADDVAGLRKLVRLAIEGSGRFQVVAEAGTGLEAIAKAGEVHPDLVLLDLSMPELDGLEALPRVLEVAPKAHVVVLSGFNHVRMAPVAKRLGASAYLEKGMEPDDLTRALLEVLEPGTMGDGQARQPVAPPAGPTPTPALAPAPTPARTPAPAPPPTSPSAEAAPPSPSPWSAPMTPASATGPSFRVLVVEADPRVALRIGGLLSSPGAASFAITSTATAAEAGAYLDAGQVDLVLIDPLQAGSKPEDILIDILSRAASVPVVALLPRSATDLIAGAMRLGIEDCLHLEELDAGMLNRSVLYAIERRRAHDARRQVRDQEVALQRMRDLEALKAQFFNAAAHELGTPLTPIRLQLAVLKTMTKSADSAERRSIDILDRNVARLAQLNHDILDVARLQAGKLSVERQPMDLLSLVQEVHDTFEPLARSAGVTLDVVCPLGATVDADAQRIGQVLFNLVSNALKFTPRGGKVSIETVAAGEECRISVRDTGVGLREDQIAQLFQPFAQVLGPKQPRGVGTGLGLFVSRGIVELHGGHIWAQSAGPGRGSTFSFVLPRKATFVHPSAASAPVAVASG